MMGSFTDRKYDMALDLIAEMNSALVYNETPCDLCFTKDREWCSKHCEHTRIKNCQDVECFKKYFDLRLRDEVRKEIGRCD